MAANGFYVARAIGAALVVGVAVTILFITWAEVTQRPTRLGSGDSKLLSSIPPFIDGAWVKVPFDRERDIECLTQSRFFLTRVTNYPLPLATREDDITLQLINTPVSGLGRHSKLLWFPLGNVPAGPWSIAVEAGHDCGSWLHPGVTETGPITLGQIVLQSSR